MSDFQLSQANDAYIKKLQSGTQNPIGENQPAPVEKKKDNSDKLKLALVGLGIVAAAGIGIYAATHGKKIKLENIEFDKGFARLKGAKEGFTGKIQDTLEGGDKIILEYKDGIIQSSTRKGKVNFTKVFQEIDGDKIVRTTVNGKPIETNISKIQAEVKASQSELDKILKDKDNLSLDEFRKQTDAIEFKNKAQQAEINGVISAKKEEIRRIEAYKRVNKSRAEVTLEKGRAKFDGLPYQGKVHTTLPNGDKVVMEYDSFGRLIKSTRTGERNFVKEYNPYLNTVKITENGETKNVDIDALRRNGIAKKEELERVAREIAKKEAYNAKLTKEAEAFKGTLTGKTDDDLAAIKQQLIDERNKLTSRGFELAGGNHGQPEVIALNALSKEERYRYDLLNLQINRVNAEEDGRVTKFIEKLLKRPGDTPVSSKFCSAYLSDEEVAQIRQYYDVYGCNDYLRGVPGATLDTNIEIMDSAFKKAPPLTQEAVVYRGVSVGSHKDTDKKFIDSIKEGAILDNPGFTSTSPDCTNAQFRQFASAAYTGEKDGVLMRIHLPKGTKGILGAQYGCREYTLPRGARMKVTKLEIIDGVKVADCEYILPKA